MTKKVKIRRKIPGLTLTLKCISFGTQFHTSHLGENLDSNFSLVSNNVPSFNSNSPKDSTFRTIPRNPQKEKKRDRNPQSDSIQQNHFQNPRTTPLN